METRYFNTMNSSSLQKILQTTNEANSSKMCAGRALPPAADAIEKIEVVFQNTQWRKTSI